MLITKDSPEAHTYIIYDCIGHLIPYVVSFDTETEEIEMPIRVPSKQPDHTEEEVKKLVEDHEKEKEKEESTVEDADGVDKVMLPKSKTEFLMQNIPSEEGNPEMGVVFVKFKLPGAYACKDGKLIQ